MIRKMSLYCQNCAYSNRSIYLVRKKGFISSKKEYLISNGNFLLDETMSWITSKISKMVLSIGGIMTYL